MVQKENFAIFEKEQDLQNKQAMPTKLRVNACDINPYLQDRDRETDFVKHTDTSLYTCACTITP